MRPVYETRLPWREQGITFIGDPHTFKVPALTEELRQDLIEAKRQGDKIVIWGDIHEWIVPSDLKRFNNAKHGMKVNAYVNKVVTDLADFYEPFVNNIEIMKLGNHESEFIKRHHADPMAYLVQELNRRRDPKLHPICYGGYTLWWIVKMIRKSAAGYRNNSNSVTFWLHHGKGGGAQVTRGAIDRARIYDEIFCDVAVIGHKHQQMHIPTKVEFLDSYGNVQVRKRDFIQIAGFSGWEQELPSLTDGYILEWGAEKFYGREMTGSVRVVLKPEHKHGQPPKIRRRVEMVSE